MQKDFLALLPTYVKSVSEGIRQRRAIVAVWLGPRYNFPRNQTEKAMKDVFAKTKKEVSLSLIRNDAAVYRAAYRYLTNATARGELRKLCENQPALGYLTGVRALIKEGIAAWEELEARFQKPPAPSVTTLPVKPAPSSIAATLAQLGRQVSALIVENERMVKQLAEEAAKSGLLQQELVMVKEALNRDHIARLRQIAAEAPENPQLTAIAEKLEEEIAVTEKDVVTLLSRLPKTYQWENGNGSFSYEETFLRAVVNFSGDEQQQVVAALEKFARDRTYSSLQTKRALRRLPYSPARSMMSRAASDLRFSWRHADSVVTIYWAWRRGDSRTGQSEA